MTPDDFRDPNKVHRECWDILPWIANERAGAQDRARAELHLRECAACREELERQRSLREAIRQEEAVVIAPQTSLQKLMQRIDGQEEEPAEVPTREPVEAESPMPAPRALPRWLPIAAAFQAVAIAGLLGTVWWQARATLEAPRFTTLTSAASMAHGPVIRVVFAPDVSIADINGALRSIPAEIVSGPSEAGVFTLALPDHDESADRVHQALVRLRSNTDVIFAEVAVARPEHQ
jgi:hypothetical protein